MKLARFRVDFDYELAKQPGVRREHHVIVGAEGAGEALLLARGHLEASPEIGYLGDLKASYVGSETPSC